MTATELYERDGLAWSERQAALLRKMMAGERPNETPDWPNIVEEIEAMGRSELRQVESLLLQAMIHLLKLRAWPASGSNAEWTEKADGFLDDAERAFTPSMRQRIDVADLYEDALRNTRLRADESGSPRQLPNTSPFALDDLLAKPPDVDALVAKLAAATP